MRACIKKGEKVNDKLTINDIRHQKFICVNF